MSDGPASSDAAFNLGDDDAAVLDLLRELLAAPCPSGREEALAAVVRQRIEAMGLTCETIAGIGLLVRIGGQHQDTPPLMLAAHIDEIGLVVTGIEDDGRLRIDRSGQLKPHKLGEGPVDLIGDGDDIVPGVVSFGVGHPTGGSAPGSGSDAAARWSDARILTGLSPEALAKRGIRVGSAAVPPAWRRGPVLLGEADRPLVAGWSFDDRGGVASTLLLLERLASGDIKPHHPLLVAFTVHEEGGCHGAKNLAAAERPGLFIAVDGAPIFPGSDLTLDRPCVWSKDAKAHSDQRLVAALLDAGRRRGTTVQPAVMPGAYSDASAVYDAGFCPRVATFGHVRENSHGFEVARLDAFAAVADVLHTLIEDPL